MTFNPLNHPISFTYPLRTALSAWIQHTPFAMLLVDLLRPSLFVELGSHRGTSYCAFCQAVKALNLDCRCYAVDTWEGDAHAGYYGSDVLSDLREHHDSQYSSFSQLMQCTFDEACGRFEDHSIDLLHIDGYHTYEAVRHDFDLWLPKMSDRGVVVFHDIAEHQVDFGVWQLWSEIESQYKSNLAFYHGHGLGVVAVGDHVPDAVRELMEVSGPHKAALRVLMGELGRRIEDREDAHHLREENARLGDQIAERDHEAQETEAMYLRALTEAREHLAAISYLSERGNEARRHQADLEDARGRVALLQTRLGQAQAQLNWLESSRGVRMVKLARAARAVMQRKGPFALGKHITLWSLGRRGYALRDIVTPETTVSVLAATANTSRQRAIMFLSDVPNSAMRYRCSHHAEALEMVGYTCDVGVYGEVDLADIVDRYTCFVLHRVPFNPDVEHLIQAAHRWGKSVFFDTDDWVFDLDVPQFLPAYDDLDKDAQRHYVNGLELCQRTLQACDGAIVSTDSLRPLAARYNKNVVVVPNMVSQAMLDGADAALEWIGNVRRTSTNDTVTIGYFSGTSTHNRDFLLAADAILAVLDRYPEVVFKVVGELKLDKRFNRFGSRVVRFGPQQWQDLPRMYTTLDISIAPLEADNPYTDAKSCIKYLEAALCEVPTVASPRTDFRRTIEHGKNGFLAETSDEWYDALSRLIESPELRCEMGRRASEAVRANETSQARAVSVHETLRSLAIGTTSGRDRPKLTINWILHAPTAEPDSQYHTIFRLVNHLGKQGHQVRIYVEPSAHLAPLSPNQIQTYITKHFGQPNAEVIVGHEHILPADASIATSWLTAYTVACHEQSRHKFYFIQGFEPEFYDLADPLYTEAERSYSLPLQHICMGGHLGQRIEAFSRRTSEVIDFATDHMVFQMRRVPEDRKGPPKVLFFTRPGLKRRGFEIGIEALRAVKEQRPDVQILLFGATDQELGPLPFKATNLGVLDQRALVDTLNRVHILVSFSLTDLSLVPFEGMACGAAVVEADVPAVRSMIPTGKRCMLAAPNAAAFADVVLRLIDDEVLRHRIAHMGAEFMARHNWEHSATQFEDVLLRYCWPGKSATRPETGDSSELTSNQLGVKVVEQAGRLGK